MANEVVKTSKSMKAINAHVRMHLDAVERARDIYVASSKRLEAEYFARIQHAAEIITGGGGNGAVAEAVQPEQAPAASS